MSPEQRRLLDLLAARAYRLAAHMNLHTALIVEEFETDRRSRAFEHWFGRAVHYERVAWLLDSGRMRFDDGPLP